MSRYAASELYGLDGKLKMKNTERVLQWLSKAEKPSLTKEQIRSYFQTITPRSQFFKTLPKNATVLDLGAGSGALSVLRNWPPPQRHDVDIYAFSLTVGEQFREYVAYEIGDFEQRKPEFDGRIFSAIVCAHFLEHMRDPEACLHWIASRLKAEGRLYIEWPHPISADMPTLGEVREATGIDVMTINFYDDKTHQALIEPYATRYTLEECGFDVESGGRIRFPFIADEMRNIALSDRDPYFLTMAIWHFVGWAQYYIAQLCREPLSSP